MNQFSDIAADFAFLDDWDERYKYLIDIGRKLADYPADKRDEHHKVKGCASQVWLTHDLDQSGPEPVLQFNGDSDAHIVKGLVALLLALYSGRTPKEILALDLRSCLAPLDLDNHLTPQRSNGLAAMATRIRSIAETEHSRS